jgi:hypothetical protein
VILPCGSPLDEQRTTLVEREDGDRAMEGACSVCVELSCHPDLAIRLVDENDVRIARIGRFAIGPGSVECEVTHG